MEHCSFTQNEISKKHCAIYMVRKSQLHTPTSQLIVSIGTRV